MLYIYIKHTHVLLLNACIGFDGLCLGIEWGCLVLGRAWVRWFGVWAWWFWGVFWVLAWDRVGSRLGVLGFWALYVVLGHWGLKGGCLRLVWADFGLVRAGFGFGQAGRIGRQAELARREGGREGGREGRRQAGRQAGKQAGRQAGRIWQ